MNEKIDNSNETIDSLMMEPKISPEAIKKQKNNKKKANIKNIIFAIITILLICGVGFGLYYYLNMGTKKSSSNKTIDNKSSDIITKIVYKKVGSSIDAKELVNKKGAEIINKDEITQKMNTIGGPYSVSIQVDKQIVYAAVVVVQNDVSKVLSCSKNGQTDMFAFDSENINLGYAMNLNSMKYSTQKEYEKLLNLSSEIIVVDGIENLYIRNDKTQTISLIRFKSQEELTSEYGSSFPLFYEETKNYYENDKNYKCE